MALETLQTYKLSSGLGLLRVFVADDLCFLNIAQATEGYPCTLDTEEELNQTTAVQKVVENITVAKQHRKTVWQLLTFVKCNKTVTWSCFVQ